MKKIVKGLLALGLGLGFTVAQAQNVTVTGSSPASNVSYPTLKAAIDAVNAGTHTGAVQVLFTNNTTETAKASLNASGNGSASYSSLLIGVDPNISSDITVTSTVSADRVLDIGGSNVTIDGRINQTGTTRKLKFSLATASSSGIRFIAASGFPMGNSNVNYIHLEGLGATATGSGLFLGTSAQAAKDSNLTANGVYVKALSLGIIVGSASRPNHTKTVTITNCTLENVNTTNIDLNTNSSAEGTLTATGNTIFHSGGYANVTTSAVLGIAFTGSSSQLNSNNPQSVIIRRNSIYNLSTNPATGNPAVRGINFTASGYSTSANGALNVEISNNNIQWSGTTNTSRGLILTGMIVSLGATSTVNDARGTVGVYNNTIVIGGTNVSGGIAATTTQTRGLWHNAQSQNTTYRSYNNVVVVTRTGGGNTRHLHSSFGFNGLDGGNNYLAPTTGFNFRSDYNIYWKAATSNAFAVSGPHLGGFLFGTTSTASTLSGELTDIYGGIQETHSSDLQVTYPSVSSPAFNNSFNSNTAFIGTTLAGITTDFFGTTRDAQYPYIGAYEGASFPNDLTVTQVYTLGKIPYPYAFPHVVTATVKNQGIFQNTNVTVSLNITGANTVTKTFVIDTIDAGESVNITFPAVVAGDITNPNGTQTLSVSVPNDDINSNNSTSVTQDISINTYSLGYRIPPATNPVASGGVGFNGATGDFVAKFLCSQASEVNQARVYFSGSGGIQYRILIFADDSGGNRPGSLLYSSAIYTSVNSVTAFDTKDISPAVAVSGNFYIGVRQLGTSNVSFSYQSEAPPRAGSFYFTSPAGTTGWTDFASSNSPFRFLIEPRLRASDDLNALEVASPLSSGCYTGTTPLSVTVTNAGQNDADFSVNPMTITVNVTGQTTGSYTTTVNSGTLVKDASQTFLVASLPATSMQTNGAYTYTATISYGPDLITDNNVTPGKQINVDRASAYPVNIGFTPTGATNGFVIDRYSVSGGAGWVFAANQGSPAIAPLSGTGVMTVDFFNNFTSQATARAQMPCLSMPPAAFPVMQFYMSQDNGSTNSDSLRILLSTDGGVTYNFHSNYARFNAGTAGGWRTVKVNLPNTANLRVALDARRSTNTLASSRNISVHDIQIYDCGSGGLWLGASNDWFDGNNWCSGTVPNAATDVIVQNYNGVAVPTVSGQAASCKKLTLKDGRDVVLANDPATALSINGDVTLAAGSEVTDNTTTGAGVTINGPASVSFAAGQEKTFRALTLDGAVTLTAGSKVNISEQLDVLAGSVFTNNGQVRLLSTTSKTANLGSIDNTTTYTGTGTMKVRRAISNNSALTSGGYHQIASPIAGATLNTMFGAYTNRVPMRFDSVQFGGLWYYANVWKYNALSSNMSWNGWEVPANASHSMSAGKSVRLWFPNGFWNQGLAPFDVPLGMYEVSGTPNIGDVTVPLDYCATGCAYSDPNGYNLIGNPYPSAINWSAMNSNVNVDDALWVWNASTGNYGSFVANVGANGQTNIIPSSAGFFVRANGAGASVNFNEDVKSANTTTAFLRSAARSLFRVKMTGSGVRASDEAVVVFRSGATAGHDRQYDAGKLVGSILSLWTTPQPGVNMAINSMPEMTATPVDLPLNFTAASSGSYTFNFNGFEDMPVNAVMFLKDNFTNTMTPITEGMDYTFVVNTSNPATTAAGRFVITYQLNGPTSIANGLGRSAMVVYPNPSKAGAGFSIAVQNMARQNVKLNVVDVVGRSVYSTEFTVNGLESETKAINPTLAAGVYTVVMDGAFGRLTQRITIE